MNDTETLREVLRFSSGALEIAESFYDASAVMILTEIIDIIAERGHSYADVGTVSHG